jgi:hypothetical protein
MYAIPGRRFVKEFSGTVKKGPTSDIFSAIFHE